MLQKIKDWYNGTPMEEDFDDDSAMPLLYVEYHWTAKIARSCVAFYLRNWQWIWPFIVSVIGLLIAI